MTSGLGRGIDDVLRKIESGEAKVYPLWKGRPVLPTDKWKAAAGLVGYMGNRNCLNPKEAFSSFPNTFIRQLFWNGVPEGYENTANAWYREYIQLMKHLKDFDYEAEKQRFVEEALF